MDPKKPTPRHIIIKMPKIKERILKEAREKRAGCIQGQKGVM